MLPDNILILFILSLALCLGTTADNVWIDVLANNTLVGTSSNVSHITPYDSVRITLFHDRNGKDYYPVLEPIEVWMMDDAGFVSVMNATYSTVSGQFNSTTSFWNITLPTLKDGHGYQFWWFCRTPVPVPFSTSYAAGAYWYFSQNSTWSPNQANSTKTTSTLTTTTAARTSPTQSLMSVNSSSKLLIQIVGLIFPFVIMFVFF